MEWVQLLLKAVLGTCLFSLILWCAQSRNPRAAGMMLTFPALNGLGLLTAASHDVPLMAPAMLPMIALNGLLCAIYIVVQRQPLWCLLHCSPRLQVHTVLTGCVVLWVGVAVLVAPLLQRYLASTSQVMTFIGVYAVASVPLTRRLLWSPMAEPRGRQQRFRGVLRANAVRLVGMFVLLALVMLVAHYGAAAWAGRLSALPVLPFYSLLLLSLGPSPVQCRVASLAQVGSTVLIGPLIAMGFVWAFASYLSALPWPRSAFVSMAAGSLGLLILWGLCGGIMWGILHSARALERLMQPGEDHTGAA